MIDKIQCEGTGGDVAGITHAFIQVENNMRIHEPCRKGPMRGRLVPAAIDKFRRRFR